MNGIAVPYFGAIMIKRIFYVIAICLTLSACGTFKTNAVAEGQEVFVPPDRLSAYQKPESGYAKFTITRDTGLLGGGCYLGVAIEGKPAARLDTGEMAVFYVKPGMVAITVMYDPEGRGLCALSSGMEPVTRMYKISLEKTKRFRLSSRQYRRPLLEELN